MSDREEVRAIEDLALVRIDDRLIHGQVVAVWAKHKHFSRIVIVDDDVAADPFMQDVLSLAAPPGLTVDVLPVTEAVVELNQNTPQRRSTMVLMKAPKVAKRLYDEGLEYDALNVGGMGSGPKRKSVFRNISASPEEIEIFKYLMDEGVEITFMTVPGEKSKTFAELVDKL
jgi:PTS system mannose-specific IIB component